MQLLHRNAAWSFTAALFRLLGNAVLFIMIARFYGPEQFGQFSAAHTFATIFGMFADFGFDMLMATEIARDRTRAGEVIPRMFALKIFISVGAAVFMCVYGLVSVESSGTQTLTYVFSGYLFFSALLSYFFAVFKGFEELRHEMVITIILNLTLLVALAISGYLGASVIVIAVIFVASRILGLLLAVRRGRKLVPVWNLIVDRRWLAARWKAVSVFGVFFVFGNLFFTIDTLLLSRLCGDVEVGIYQAVFRIAALCLVLSDISIAALLPTLSRCFVSDRQVWYELGDVYARTLYFIGLLVGFVMLTGARPIIGAVYGLEKFGEAVPVFQIFGAVICVRYAVEIPALMLTTSQQQHSRMILVIYATAFNVTLNMVAIPRWGVLGAAWVSLATNTAVGIGYVVSVRKVFNVSWITTRRILPPLVIAAGSILLWVAGPAFLLPGMVLVGIAYAIVVFRIGYSVSERSMLLQASGWGGARD
jgi:O-antigen/teichoic acid export membrane protein